MNRRIKPVEACIEGAARKGLDRSLGAMQLMLLGVGAVIGTGIFVLTAVGAERAGPGLLLSFVIAATVCAFAALAYAELAAMVPVAGSAYTYSYVVIGEFVAWLVGWNLILEYAVAAATVAHGWSKYFQELLAVFGLAVPKIVSDAPFNYDHTLHAAEGAETAMQRIDDDRYVACRRSGKFQLARAECHCLTGGRATSGSQRDRRIVEGNRHDAVERQLHRGVVDFRCCEDVSGRRWVVEIVVGEWGKGLEGQTSSCFSH